MNPQQTRNLELAIQQMAATYMVPRHMLTIDTYPDPMGNIVVTLMRQIAAYDGSDCNVVEVRYPADWWQAVKQRWFPAWALRRWPVVEIHKRWKAVSMLPDFPLPETMRRRIPIWTLQNTDTTEGA